MLVDENIPDGMQILEDSCWMECILEESKEGSGPRLVGKFGQTDIPTAKRSRPARSTNILMVLIADVPCEVEFLEILIPGALLFTIPFITEQSAKLNFHSVLGALGYGPIALACATRSKQCPQSGLLPGLHAM